MSEDDEDVFASFSPSDRINEGFLDVCVVHVEVAAQNAPEHALEGGDAGALDGTGDELQVEGDVARRDVVLAVLMLKQRRRAVIQRLTDVLVMVVSLSGMLAPSHALPLDGYAPSRRTPPSRAGRGEPQ